MIKTNNELSNNNNKLTFIHTNSYPKNGLDFSNFDSGFNIKTKKSDQIPHNFHSNKDNNSKKDILDHEVEDNEKLSFLYDGKIKNINYNNPTFIK